MYKNSGKFFNTYNEDALLINYLLGYKLLDGKRAGFPDIALEKVTSKLEECNISYTVNYLDKEPIKKDFRKRNAYHRYLKEAKEKIDFKTRAQLILSKIENASLQEIEEILELIDEYYRK